MDKNGKVYSTHSICVTQFIIIRNVCGAATQNPLFLGFWCINRKMSHSQRIQRLKKKLTTTTTTVLLNGLNKTVASWPQPNGM